MRMFLKFLQVSRFCPSCSVVGADTPGGLSGPVAIILAHTSAPASQHVATPAEVHCLGTLIGAGELHPAVLGKWWFATVDHTWRDVQWW